MPEYIVVARAASALYFPDDGYFRVNQFPSPLGPLEILFQTRRSWMKGHDTPIPRGLWVEVRGQAPTFRDALDVFPQIAETLSPVLTVVANAPTDPLVPELAFDCSDSAQDRDFFQQFLFDERLLPFTRPTFPGGSARAVFDLLGKHADKERLHRAMAHYHAALQSWYVGGEIMALGHLYMGIEALTPVLLRDHLQLLGGLTREQLTTNWSIQPRHLDSEVRRRLIFNGDSELYSRAKEASDGFEHGYLPFQTIRQHAVVTRDGTARALRMAIFAGLALSKEDTDVLSKPPYDQVPSLRIDKYVFGSLRGTLDKLAPDNENYPILGWSSSVRGIVVHPDGTTTIQFNEKMTPRLGVGTTFTPKRFEVWGGPGTAPQSAQPEGG
jgi:hypothetical protein